MRILDNKDRVGSLLVLGFALVYLRYALVLPLDPFAGDDSFTARTLPVGLSVAAILFSIIQLALSTRKGGEDRISEAVQGFNWRPTLWLVLLMSVYSVVFEFLGFIVCSFLFLQLGFLILGERRILLSTSVASILVVFLWVMLTQVFGLYLDSGNLYRSLVG